MFANMNEQLTTLFQTLDKIYVQDELPNDWTVTILNLYRNSKKVTFVYKVKAGIVSFRGLN